MLKVTPISDIAYLTESAASARTAVAYYTDTKSEPPGKWWCPGAWIAKDGDMADALSVTRLAQGRHPATGRQIVTGQGDKKRAATDLTFSTPKAWTALWVVTDQDGRSTLDEMLMASVRECLNEVLAAGLIEARIGKGGLTREPMKGLVAALYRHTTSREGDPQAHIHAALLNVGMRKDGQVRAINNEKLCKVHKVIGAAFRLRLAEKLEAVGVPVRADLEHGFIIDGQPAELADIWSKRRKQIVKAAREDGLAGTAGRLKQIDNIVKRTRGKKANLPSMEMLEARWRDEAVKVGWTPQAEWSRLDRLPITRMVETDAEEAEVVVRQALEKITEKHSIFYRHEIEAMALTLAVGRSNRVAVQKAVALFFAREQTLDLKKDGMLTTRTIVAQEQEIVQIARSRQNEQDAGFSQAARQLAVNDSKFSVEQKDAIDHALAPNGVSVVEGGPGVGKTTAAAKVKAACLHDGRRLILTAPAWAAVETLKNELQYDGPALAVDKLLFDVREKNITLQCGDVVLVDEAGMMGTAQLLGLMRAAQRAGAKMILQGDTNQIAAVNRGDPLALIGSAIGSQKIRTIRRQKVAWQREASMLAQKGKIGQALAAYASHDSVHVADDQEAALEAMATVFKQAEGDAVAIGATNVQVTAINAVLRAAAREIGIISGREIIVRAVPRGHKGKPQPVDLTLAKGDRLILGGESVIGGITLRNASRLKVKAIVPGSNKILLETGSGELLLASAADLAAAGKGGKPIVMQHAYAITAHAAQGATWSRTLWLASHEDSRGALVAMTRHRDDLTVFVDKSAMPIYGDIAINIGRSGLVDPDQPVDVRSDMEIIAAMGKSMERTVVPRNALDVLGMPEPVPTAPTAMPGLQPLPRSIEPKNVGARIFGGIAFGGKAWEQRNRPKKLELRREAAASMGHVPSTEPDVIVTSLPEDEAESYAPS